MSTPYNIDTMLSLLIKQDRAGLVEIIKESKIFDDLLEGYVCETDLRDTEQKLKEVKQNLEFIESLSRSLHEAICEGRKDDAICLLSQMFDEHFNDSATYAKLFPGRVK